MDQDDVLKNKGWVTRSSIGLQLWDADAHPQGGSGTAERAARISAGQKAAEARRPQPRWGG